jgi:replicative DNA helicase
MDDFLQRTPPQNIEAEQSVLGAILLRGVSTHSDRDPQTMFAEQSQTLARAQAQLHADDFYRESHRVIFRAMLDLHQRKTTVDAVTLTDALKSHQQLDAIGGPNYIAELAKCVPTAENIEHYARVVREKAVLRTVASTANEVASSAYDSPPDVDGFLAEARARLSAVTQLEIGAPEPSLAEATEEVLRSVERGELAGVKTGFRALDDDGGLVAGGFSRGDLIILAATTSAGKTSLAANIALRARRGGTLVLSLEMNRDAIIRRCLSDLGFVDWAAIARRRPAVPNGEEQRQLQAAAKQLSEMPVEILHRRALTPAGVRREALRALSRWDGKLDLIVIDYLQLMNSDEPQKRRDLEIASITKALKDIASEFNVPVLLLSQVNREAVKTESGEPELWHLRESGAIEQDADVVIFLWDPRDSGESYTSDLKIRWKISKQRNGPKLDLGYVLFEAPYTRFRDS